MKSPRVVRLPVFLGSLALALAVLGPPAARGQDARFRRSDANLDSKLDLADAVFTLRLLFMAGAATACPDAADANDDGGLDISDPLFTLSFLFIGGSEPPAPGLLCGGDPTADALGCTSYEHCVQTPVLGQSEFETRTVGAPPGMQMGRGQEDQFGVPAADPAPPAADPAGPAAPERLIEESDIWKLQGELLFVLNHYRGLQVIDIADLDRPKLIGKAPIFGYPREMYVRGSRAYVIVSDYYAFWREVAVPDSDPYGFHGSQLRIVDIADPENPRVVGGINVEGEVSDSRIVGDVMYLVSNRWSWYSRYDSDDTVDQTTVVSVAIADPADVRIVDQHDFPRNGWEHHLSVTPETIYLASSGYDANDWRAGYKTRIRAIDISDPAGRIVLRGEAAAPGRVQDRWSLDEHQGVLRVASGQSWGNGDVYLTTYSVADPDAIVLLGGYTLHVDERLTAARFDGPRGYLVSYRNIDPLFTFDLSDPARPTLLGELEMTGWLDFIVPMGDRLVALGHEDLVRPDGGRDIKLAVSLIDVAQAAAPKLLSRAAIDGAWGWVPGDRDDFAKVFRTVPEQGLILFPFQAWDPASYRSIGGVQLIDLQRDTLVRRGLIRDAGWVERGIPYDERTVLTLSSNHFQAVDIADRDQPRVRSRIELARNVQDFALLPGDQTVQLAGDWWRGDIELLTTPLADPNATEPLARVHLPAPYGRLFLNGSLAYVASVQEVKGDDGQLRQTTRIQVVDLADPAAPKLRGSVALPVPVWLSYQSWYWWWGDEAVQVNGSTLAFHRFTYSFFRCLACDVAAGPIGWEPEPHTIYIVDLEDPDNPVLASTVVLKDVPWAWGLKAAGSLLYLSVYRTHQDLKDGSWVTRYFLKRIDLADPASPEELPEVNIPGFFVDAAPGGETIYTQETRYQDWNVPPSSFIYALALIEDKAYLQSQVEIKGSINSVLVRGSAAFASTYWWQYLVVDGVQRWENRAVLHAVDLSDPRALRAAGEAEIPVDYAYLQEVEGGRAFVGSYAGIFTFDVRDLDKPVFEKFFRTQGWSQKIVARDDRAYVPSGYYGVQVLELGGGVAP